MKKVQEIKNLLTALEFEIISKDEFDKRLKDKDDKPKKNK